MGKILRVGHPAPVSLPRPIIISLFCENLVETAIWAPTPRTRRLLRTILHISKCFCTAPSGNDSVSSAQGRRVNKEVAGRLTTLPISDGGGRGSDYFQVGRLAATWGRWRQGGSLEVGRNSLRGASSLEAPLDATPLCGHSHPSMLDGCRVAAVSNLLRQLYVCTAYCTIGTPSMKAHAHVIRTLGSLSVVVWFYKKPLLEIERVRLQMIDYYVEHY